MENLLLIKTLTHFIIWKGNENMENESKKIEFMGKVSYSKH